MAVHFMPGRRAGTITIMAIRPHTIHIRAPRMLSPNPQMGCQMYQKFFVCPHSESSPLSLSAMTRANQEASLRCYCDFLVLLESEMYTRREGRWLCTLCLSGELGQSRKIDFELRGHGRRPVFAAFLYYSCNELVLEWKGNSGWTVPISFSGDTCTFK